MYMLRVEGCDRGWKGREGSGVRKKWSRGDGVGAGTFFLSSFSFSLRPSSTREPVLPLHWLEFD